MSEAGVPCVVCGGPLAIRLAYGRQSNKPFVMLICPRDGRHFRGFIHDRDFVARALAQAASNRQEGQGTP